MDAAVSELIDAELTALALAADPDPQVGDDAVSLWDLAGEGETDPYRLAQAVRRVVGRWVSDKWRRKPMIVPTVITSAVAQG